MSTQPIEKQVTAECVLPAELVTLKTAEYLEKYAPFGAHNPQPVFQISDVTCVTTQTVGKMANHRKYTFKIGEKLVAGMTWYQPEPLATANTADLTIIASLGIETWRQKSLLLGVKDIGEPRTYS